MLYSSQCCFFFSCTEDGRFLLEPERTPTTKTVAELELWGWMSARQNGTYHHVTDQGRTESERDMLRREFEEEVSFHFQHNPVNRVFIFFFFSKISIKIPPPPYVLD